MPAHDHLGAQFGPASVPPEFGTSPIPSGMMRFHHYTGSPEAAESIKSTGLLRSHSEESYARGGTESPEVFATAGAPSDDFKRTHHYVEGYADPKRGGQLNIGENWRDSDPAEHIANTEGRRNTITARGDIPANQIVAAHEPWHETYRYIQQEQGKHSMERGVMAGDYDTHSWASPDLDLQKAVDTTKVALAAKVMAGGKLEGKSYADEGLPTERTKKRS